MAVLLRSKFDVGPMARPLLERFGRWRETAVLAVYNRRGAAPPCRRSC
jgi:hypothetical protein